MTTNSKDFKIKNGLIVQGATATVNGNNVITSASSIDDLADVDIAEISDGQALLYDNASSSFKPGTPPAGADGVGVPAGGSSGQILIKSSSTDYDTEWSGPEANTIATTGKAIAMSIVFG